MNARFTHPIRFIPMITDDGPKGTTPQRQSFVEILSKLIYSSMELSIQQVQLIQSEIEEMFHKLSDQISQSQRNSNDIFNEILNDYEKRFDSNKSDCVRVQMEVLKNVTSNGRDNVLKCVESAVKDVDDIRERLTPYIESIGSLIKNVKEANKRCSWTSNQISMGICVVQNVCFKFVQVKDMKNYFFKCFRWR